MSTTGPTEPRPADGTPDAEDDATQVIATGEPTEIIETGGSTRVIATGEPTEVIGTGGTADTHVIASDEGTEVIEADSGSADEPVRTTAFATAPTADPYPSPGSAPADPYPSASPDPYPSGPAASGATPPPSAPASDPGPWTAPAPTPAPVPEDRGPRSGTVVWGLVVAAVGVGVLAMAAGARIDAQLALIVLLAGAGAALLIGSVVSAARRRGRETRA